MTRLIVWPLVCCAATPSLAFADNCGSLDDCYGTILAAALVAMAIAVLVGLVMLWLPEVFGLAAAETAAGTEISADGLAALIEHLARFPPYPPNAMMIERLEAALEAGEMLTGADANFYLHELFEADLMGQGMLYDPAHAAALEFYGVSPFSLYHPEVVQAFPGYFNSNWFAFWGLPWPP